MATPLPENRATFTLDEVARATAGTLRPGARPSVRGVRTDSRAVGDGALFVALRGATHDGHRFLGDVARAGAAAVVVARGEGGAVPAEVSVVEVDDTLRALGDLAAFHRGRLRLEVAGVTGSAGKTTTKELLAAALSADGRRVRASAGNLNNLIGLPMTLLDLDDATELAVLEMGTNRPGEIARLAEIARPKVGVVTLVAAAHTEGLGTVDAVADEKVSLLLALPPDGAAVLDADDRRVAARLSALLAARRVTFGRGEGADVRLLSWTVEPSLRTRCELTVRGRPLPLELALLGEAAALSATAALAAAVALDVAPERAAAGMRDVLPAPGRMHARELHGLVLIDDSYNANPRSTELALRTAAALARARGVRLVAVLGDMKELGARSAEDHRAAGRLAAEVGAAALVAVGPEMVRAAFETEAAGIPSHLAPSAAEAAPIVRSLARAGDVVLVKGSRSMAMERTVAALQPGRAG